MRICTFSLGGDARVGLLFGDEIADLTLAFAVSLGDIEYIFIPESLRHL